MLRERADLYGGERRVLEAREDLRKSEAELANVQRQLDELDAYKESLRTGQAHGATNRLSRTQKVSRLAS